jgi:hypothetical protein
VCSREHGGGRLLPQGRHERGCDTRRRSVRHRSRPGAFTQAYALIHPFLFGAMGVQALLRRGRSAWWMLALLLLVSVLDIIGRPHILLLSGLALASGALALILVLRRFTRAALGAVALWAVSLAASLSLGRGEAEPAPTRDHGCEKSELGAPGLNDSSRAVVRDEALDFSWWGRHAPPPSAEVNSPSLPPPGGAHRRRFAALVIPANRLSL